MKCEYKHHKETYGKDLGKCKIHPEEEIQCGAFEHGCLKCNPRKCCMCGANQIFCCC
jgi:hypothetical protein